VFSGARVGAHDEFAPVANPAVTVQTFCPLTMYVAVETRFCLDRNRR